jgi:CHAT domain-containing protein
MKPYRYNDNDEREDDPFWCQQFAISRWLSGPGTADELLVGAARPVAPIHVNLRSVQEEVSFIKHLRDLHPDIISLEPFSDCMEVLQWLEKGEFSMLHFACHGMFDATTPDNSAIMLSGSSLRPSDIRVRFGGRRPRPLLFINACHGARTGFSFTGLGGWAERLVEARVGAFVGAMWEVNDGLALQFARRFYTGLLKDNQTIAEAFRQAREEIRQLAPYNSTWLAYALYADPEGRFKDSPLADKPSAEIRKTDSNHINSSDTPPSNSNQNSTEVRNAQNKKSLGLKWWIQYIIAPLIGVVIVYVITAIINAPTSKFPQQEPSRSPKPNTLLK